LASYVTQADLATVRHAQEAPVPLKHKQATQEATGEPSAQQGRPGHHTNDSDVIGAADSDVGREVEALIEWNEEDQEQQQEERPPLAKTSANIQRVAEGQAPLHGASRGGQRRKEREGYGEEKGSRFMSGHSLRFLPCLSDLRESRTD
jgi:hypothetical protein